MWVRTPKKELTIQRDMMVSTVFHDTPMPRGPPPGTYRVGWEEGRGSSLTFECPQLAGWSLRHGGWSQKACLFLLRENPWIKLVRVSRPGKCRHAFLVFPPGVPRERCPFSGRVGGVSIRVLKGFRRETSDRPGLPYPELELVTASAIFPAYVNPLARRFLKHRSLAECSVLPGAFG